MFDGFYFRLRTAAAAMSGLILLMSPGLASDALRGVALVIGESEYQNLPDLPNARNDARALGELFYELGFDVTSVTDADQQKLSRSIERFIEDAREADVALVYYSGHGIEVGGQDFVIPVDADVSTPETAGASLLRANDLLERLQSVSPIAIVLLDACRSSPFPDGQLIRLPGSSEPLPVTDVGLAALRGPSVVSANRNNPESLGAVFGFSAEPGKPALDGHPGTNSPYAEALLRHFAANGYSFADVMTMVTEEVYLKTDGRQLPWTNSALRRVISFGPPVSDGGDADEALLLNGRRELLLAIAAAPAAVRNTVAGLAAEQSLPLAQLFGVLKRMGIDTDDAEELDTRLRAAAEDIKGRLDDLSAITNSDPEVKRLLDLARRAREEGAVAESLTFALRASARTTDLSAKLDDLAADIDRRRIENAATYAAAGDAAWTAWDFQVAATQYALASDELSRARLPDPMLMFNYRVLEGNALLNLGENQGDNAALSEAVAIFSRLVPAEGNSQSQEWATAQYNLGSALSKLGQREGNEELLEEAVVAFRAALDASMRKDTPLFWAKTQTSLGNALRHLGERGTGTERLEQALAAYRLALQEYRRDREPLDWAAEQHNIGATLTIVGGRETGTERLEEAVAAFRLALEETPRDLFPLRWAMTQDGLGLALRTLGDRERGTVRLEDAAATYRLALEEYARYRDRVPLDWAGTQNNLGDVLATLGQRESGTERLKEAVVAFRLALEEITRERVPLDWAKALHNIGTTETTIGVREGDKRRLEESVAVLRLALEERTRNRDARAWTSTQMSLGRALFRLGEQESGTDRLEEAVTAYRLALEERPRHRVPLEWAATQNNLGLALRVLGERETGNERLEEAVVAFRLALEEYRRDSDPLGWARAQTNLGTALRSLGEREPGTDLLEQAVVAHRLALEERPRGSAPSLWGQTQNDLGMALRSLGERKPGTDLLEQAVGALRLALEETPRRGDALYWATVQYNLGAALSALGQRQSGIAELEAAVAAYRLALEEGTRERVPLEWAATQYGLGTALRALGERTNSRPAVLEGKRAVVVAREVYKEIGRDGPMGFDQLLDEFDDSLRGLR